MVNVELRGHQLDVGGHAVPMLSGQVDYWLHPAPWWRRILAAVKSIGLDQVACYVPWNYHQQDDGAFDFTGRTDSTRDLAGFLDLAADADLTVVLRPGPWIYTFYADGGVPMSASAHHRLHPGFLEPAQAYLRALAPVVLPRLATHGGPIVLVQVDNEIEPLATQRGDSGGTELPNDPVGTSYGHQLLGGGLEDPYTLRSYLAARWPDAAAFCRGRSLDAPCESAGGDRWQALDLLGLAGRRPSPIHHDVMEYYRWYCSEYAAVMAAVFRDIGIDVPLALNVFTNLEPQSSVDFAEIAQVVGGDYWGMNHLPWDQAMSFSRHVRHLRASARTPWAAEFQSVTIAEFVNKGIEDVITPDNSRYLALLGMVFGLKGWNWYTIVERSSLYFAPINNFGGKIPAYFEPFRQVHELFKRVEWPTFEPLNDATLWFDRATFRDQARFALPLDQPFNAISECGGGTWMAAFDRLSRLDVDLEIYDPEARFNAPVTGRAVVVAGGERMNLADQRALRSLAENDGAGLVFLGGVPTSGYDGDPTDALADVACLPAGQVGRLGAGRAVVLPDDADDAATLAALAAFGSVRTTASATPGVVSSAWQRGNERLIVAVNTTNRPYAGPLRLASEKLGLDRDAPEAGTRSCLVEYLLAGRSHVLHVCGTASLAVALELGPHEGEAIRLTQDLT